MSSDEASSKTPIKSGEFFLNIVGQQDNLVSPYCNRIDCDCLLKKCDSRIYYYSPNSLSLLIESYTKKIIKIEKVIYENKENQDENIMPTNTEPEANMVEILESPNFLLSKRERLNSISSIRKNILLSPGGMKVDDYSTIFSTQKKTKRLKKSTKQIQILKEMYNDCNYEWSKEQILVASEKSNLPQSVIYKWLWDKKNKCFKNK
jgi:hypothetical protein